VKETFIASTTSALKKPRAKAVASARNHTEAVVVQTTTKIYLINRIRTRRDGTTATMPWSTVIAVYWDSDPDPQRLNSDINRRRTRGLREQNWRVGE
jgi:hypothetical protein